MPPGMALVPVEDLERMEDIIRYPQRASRPDPTFVETNKEKVFHNPELRKESRGAAPPVFHHPEIKPGSEEGGTSAMEEAERQSLNVLAQRFENPETAPQCLGMCAASMRYSLRTHHGCPMFGGYKRCSNKANVLVRKKGTDQPLLYPDNVAEIDQWTEGLLMTDWKKIIRDDDSVSFQKHGSRKSVVPICEECNAYYDWYKRMYNPMKWTASEGATAVAAGVGLAALAAAAAVATGATTVGAIGAGISGTAKWVANIVGTKVYNNLTKAIELWDTCADNPRACVATGKASSYALQKAASQIRTNKWALGYLPGLTEEKIDKILSGIDKMSDLVGTTAEYVSYAAPIAKVTGIRSGVGYLAGETKDTAAAADAATAAAAADAATAAAAADAATAAAAADAAQAAAAADAAQAAAAAGPDIREATSAEDCGKICYKKHGSYLPLRKPQAEKDCNAECNALLNKEEEQQKKRNDFIHAMEDKKPEGGGHDDVVEGEATLGQATMAYQEPTSIFS